MDIEEIVRRRTEALQRLLTSLIRNKKITALKWPFKLIPKLQRDMKLMQRCDRPLTRLLRAFVDSIGEPYPATLRGKETLLKQVDSERIREKIQAFALASV